MKKLIIFFVLAVCFISCTYDEIAGGPAVVKSISIRNNQSKRIYKIQLAPIEPMEYLEIKGFWTDPYRYNIYTDSLLCVGDTIDILK